MKISIVTPVLNQAAFLERTIRSVLDQRGEFELEHLVVDGGSTDGTLEILRRYADRLRWLSEPDTGQSDAINKGLRLVNGDVLAWLNADDLYLPGALAHVAAEWRHTSFAWAFGNCRIINAADVEIRRGITAYKIWQSRGYSYRRLLRRNFIPQPAVFFSRAAYEQVGELDRDLTYAMDYDYWLRLGRRWCPRYVDHFLAAFRWHPRSKTGAAYRAAAWETFQVARRHAAGGSRLDLCWHFMHYCTLCVLYRFL